MRPDGVSTSSTTEEVEQSEADVGMYAVVVANEEEEEEFISGLISTPNLFYAEVVFQCAAPQRWRAADGGLMEMDGPQTIRARELRDLYSNVSLWVVSQEQRRHILTTLRHTVQVPHRTLPARFSVCF